MRRDSRNSDLRGVIIVALALSISCFSWVWASEDAPEESQTAIHRFDWHNDYAAGDLHRIADTVLVWETTRLTRIADGTLNLIMPFGTGHPFDGAVESVRRGYHRWGLSRFKPTRRVSDLLKALLVRELSLADFGTATQIPRVQGLIDWVQLVFADVNDVFVWPFGTTSTSYLRYPYYPIDQLQYGVDRVTHDVSMFLARCGYDVLSYVEHFADYEEPLTVPATPPNSFYPSGQSGQQDNQ
jgi:hypothetical protein